MPAPEPKFSFQFYLIFCGFITDYCLWPPVVTVRAFLWKRVASYFPSARLSNEFRRAMSNVYVGRDTSVSHCCI
jgi:hypothetical protein